MSRDHRLYLDDILKAIGNIQKYRPKRIPVKLTNLDDSRVSIVSEIPYRCPVPNFHGIDYSLPLCAIVSPMVQHHYIVMSQAVS